MVKKEQKVVQVWVLSQVAVAKIECVLCDTSIILNDNRNNITITPSWLLNIIYITIMDKSISFELIVRFICINRNDFRRSEFSLQSKTYALISLISQSLGSSSTT